VAESCAHALQASIRSDRMAQGWDSRQRKAGDAWGFAGTVPPLPELFALAHQRVAEASAGPRSPTDNGAAGLDSPDGGPGRFLLLGVPVPQ
jgi:hypothetical protein